MSAIGIIRSKLGLDYAITDRCTITLELTRPTQEQDFDSIRRLTMGTHRLIIHNSPRQRLQIVDDIILTAASGPPMSKKNTNMNATLQACYQLFLWCL